MASLVKWLHFSGARDETGAPVSSGNAYFWMPNSTSAPAAIYSDAGETNPIAHPIALDAAGRAEVYVVTDCEIVIKDVFGAQKRLSTSAEGIKAQQVYAAFQGTPDTLDAILLNISSQLTVLSAGVPADNHIVTTISTASPVFTFNPAFRVNVFKCTYAGAMGTITINVPAPLTIVKATRYRVFVQLGSGTGTTVSWDSSFIHSWGQSGSPSTLAANTYYTAEFIVNEAQNAMYQQTPWWFYGGVPW